MEKDENKIIVSDVECPCGSGYMILKNGRFGSYLESENYAEDNIREPLPSEIRKLLAQGAVEEKDGVVLLNEKIKAVKDEEARILSKAGVCEKCGKPFKVGRGRWGKFLACTG